MPPHEEPEFGSPADAPLERLAAELAALSPRAGLNRDRLMYLAGQASVAPARSHLMRSHSTRRWAWPAAFAGMTAVAASLLAAIAMQPEPQIIERVVQVPFAVPYEPPEQPPRKTASAASLAPAVDAARQTGRESFARYLDLRGRVLAMGVEGWASEAPSSGEEASPPAEYHQMLNRLLNEG